MKIRPLTPDNYNKVSALLSSSFPGSNYETQLIDKLHKNGKPLHEWVCIHRNRFIAYVAFSHAFNGSKVCGLHLGPLAVNPGYQNQGVRSELLRFCLRQPAIKESTIYVLGEPRFYQKFGFEKCAQPICPLDKSNKHFLAIRNASPDNFTVGYEPEFK